MELSLKQRILNELDNAPRGYSEELAKLAGYSSGSALVKAMKKEEGDIEIFDGFVRLVHELFPEEKFKYMDQFARTLNPQRLTARFMLEYATLYNQNETQAYLIEKLSESSNKESNDWAYVYDIDNKLSNGKIEPFEATNQLSQRKYACVEMKVFSKIVQFYAFYEMRNIYMMENLYKLIFVEIDQIKKDFAKTSFTARLFLIEADVRLHNKSIGELREKLFLVENALDPIKSYVYLQVANSYMMTNYNKSKELLLKGMECASEKSKFQVKQSLNFLAVLWDKFEEYDSDGTLSNELFYFAKKGDFLIGKSVLSKIDTDKLSDHQKAFNFYYQGILFKDKMMFYKSVEYFNKCGEKFYKQLPIMELKKIGESDYILKALSA